MTNHTKRAGPFTLFLFVLQNRVTKSTNNLRPPPLGVRSRMKIVHAAETTLQSTFYDFIVFFEFSWYLVLISLADLDHL